jgi:hypothetical protein
MQRPDNTFLITHGGSEDTSSIYVPADNSVVAGPELTGVSELYGSIEVGKKADLVLIDGNPLENISNIRNVEWTMKEGKLFYAQELYNSMGIKHFKESINYKY